MYIVIIFGRMFIEERFIQVVGQICRLVSCRFRRSQATRRLWVHFTPKSTNAHLLVDWRRLLDSLSQYEHTLKAHNFSVWKDCLSVPFQQRRWRRTAFRPEKLACLILFLSTNTKPRRHLWRSYWACIQNCDTRVQHFFRFDVNSFCPVCSACRSQRLLRQELVNHVLSGARTGRQQNLTGRPFFVSFDVGIFMFCSFANQHLASISSCFIDRCTNLGCLRCGVAEGGEVRFCLLLCVSVSVPVCSSVFPSVCLCRSSMSPVPKTQPGGEIGSSGSSVTWWRKCHNEINKKKGLLWSNKRKRLLHFPFSVKIQTMAGCPIGPLPLNREQTVNARSVGPSGPSQTSARSFDLDCDPSLAREVTLHSDQALGLLTGKTSLIFTFKNGNSVRFCEITTSRTKKVKRQMNKEMRMVRHELLPFFPAPSPFSSHKISTNQKTPLPHSKTSGESRLVFCCSRLFGNCYLGWTVLGM